MSEKGGTRLENDVLQDLAVALINLDVTCLSSVKTSLQNVVSGRTKLEPEEPETMEAAPGMIRETQNILKQFDDILAGPHHINETYLGDETTIQYWVMAVSNWHQLLNIPAESTEFLGAVLKFLESFEMNVSVIPDLVIQAAAGQVLDHNMRTVLRKKWLHIDNLIYRYHSLTKAVTKMNRRVPTWQAQPTVRLLDRLHCV